MSRKAMERMVAAGQESIDRQEREKAQAVKRKAREDWLKEPVKCALCGDSVARKATAEVKGLGNACKRHPGVGT
jgi:hypothetical protein